MYMFLFCRDAGTFWQRRAVVRRPRGPRLLSHDDDRRRLLAGSGSTRRRLPVTHLCCC